MKVIKKDQIIAFDVDDCLISENPNFSHDIIIECFNSKFSAYKNLDIVNTIKESHLAGKHIIIWSQQGFEWAQAVVIACQLKDYVDIVMTKIAECHDDLPISDWMTLKLVSVN